MNVEGLVDVYYKTGMKKRGIRSTKKTVFSINHNARSITVPIQSGKRVSVAIEDVRLVLLDDTYATDVQCAIDRIEEIIENSFAVGLSILARA